MNKALNTMKQKLKKKLVNNGLLTEQTKIVIFTDSNKTHDVLHSVCGIECFVVFVSVTLAFFFFLCHC